MLSTSDDSTLQGAPASGDTDNDHGTPDASSRNAGVNRSFQRSTIVVQGARPHAEPGTPVATPLVQSVNFFTAPGSTEELLYTRHGNSPNALALQQRLALLEGSEAALVLASGMGATACTMLSLLRPGDHLLASSWLYGGSRLLFEKELVSQGIEVSFVDPTETRGWRRSVRHNTRVLFLESPVNPTTRVLDLRPVSMLARELGLALVVDSTFASPINFRAIEYGADVVIHSATKYLNGHHDVLAGVVCGSASLVEEVRQKMIVWGQAADPFALWMLERGLKTLDVRVRRQNESAMRIASWAESHSAFARVHYPGLASHPDHSIARETLDGFGGMMAVELSGGAAATQQVLGKLQLFLHAPSLGGVESLVSEPRYTSHADLSPEARAAIGIPDGFLRLSVGLEDAADLIADLEQATA
ncbi:MAG: aminotransferase class I/II-fold pyridoxal phosphate-dependent enzyme [Phycisphaerae bacterium]|nr:aminotransferase class I/II-fold pyridoxal phosphate-dependent enzyme [Gemmatimonadaceae bacterium]